MANGYVPGELLEKVKGQAIQTAVGTQAAAVQAGATIAQGILKSEMFVEQQKEFMAEQQRLESSAVLQAALALYGIESEKEWHRMQIGMQNKAIEMLAWLKQGVNESVTIGNLLMEEGASSLGTALILETKRAISSIPPDEQIPVGVSEQGDTITISGAEYHDMMIKNLEGMQVSETGSGEVLLLKKRNQVKGGWQHESGEVKSYTQLRALNDNGRGILENMQDNLGAYIAKGWLGTERGKATVGDVKMPREDAVDMANFQEILEKLAVFLPMYQKGGKREGSIIEDTQMIASLWMGGMGNKNNPLIQKFQNELRNVGVLLSDVAFLTPAQRQGVDVMRDYREQQYMMYTRMPEVDRRNKYRNIGRVQSSMPSTQVPVQNVEEAEGTKARKQDIDWFKPVSILDTFDETALEAELTLGMNLKSIFLRLNNRIADTSRKEDIKMFSNIKSMVAQIATYKTPKFLDDKKAHNIAVELLNYLSAKIASSDEDAFITGWIAPSEARNLYMALVDEYGINFTDKEIKMFKYMIKVE